jgi:hypothetical protein
MRGLAAHALTGFVLLAVSSPAFQADKKLPYAAVNNPEFISAAAVRFLSDGDRLIGVTGGNVVKAYPAAILAQHGVVLDDLPVGPIAVTW